MENQIREKIHKIIQELPDKKLQPTLDFLIGLEKSSEDSLDKAKLIHKIFSEDAGLLKKLAK